MTEESVWLIVLLNLSVVMGFTIGELLARARASVRLGIFTLVTLGALVFTAGFYAESSVTPPACQAEDGGPTLPCAWTSSTPDENGLYTKIIYSREAW